MLIYIENHINRIDNQMKNSNLRKIHLRTNVQIEKD